MSNKIKPELDCFTTIGEMPMLRDREDNVMQVEVVTNVTQLIDCLERLKLVGTNYFCHRFEPMIIAWKAKE